MKIEVDLTGIFNEETGEVVDSVREEIIQEAVDRIYSKIESATDRMLEKLISTGIKENLDAHLSVLIPSLMDYEFQETGRYGDEVGEKTTVKNRILLTLKESCVFKDRNYSGDNNAFTNTLKDVVEKQMKLYKPEFDKQVNAMFLKEAMDYAVAQVKKKLGIT